MGYLVTLSPKQDVPSNSSSLGSEKPAEEEEERPQGPEGMEDNKEIRPSKHSRTD